MNAHDLLTKLAEVDHGRREEWLSYQSVKMLRAAADLCLVDSVDMTKREAISAIVSNF